jgi:hypothetical protein
MFDTFSWGICLSCLSQMHITKTAAAEPRIKCDVTKKELIPDLETISAHVSSAVFQENLKHMQL